MNMLKTAQILLVIAFATLPTKSFAYLLWEINDTAVSEKVRYGPCQDTIGFGGNIIASNIRHNGKCNGDGYAPEVATENGNKFLKFKSNNPNPVPNQRPGKTRSEIAHTGFQLNFGQRYYIGFRMKIPSGVDPVGPSKAFYLMQLWQCSDLSPIAGIRMNDYADRTINFMSQNEWGSASFNREDTGSRDVSLNDNGSNDGWHEFVIKLKIHPRSGGQLSEFVVWKDGVGTPIIDSSPNHGGRNYGYFTWNSCPTKYYNQRPPQHARLKFGIYKDKETGKNFEVQYDNFKVGEYYSNVKPW